MDRKVAPQRTGFGRSDQVSGETAVAVWRTEQHLSADCLDAVQGQALPRRANSPASAAARRRALDLFTVSSNSAAGSLS